ncbi:hypothetical protein [Pseudomonas sp. RIT-PI-AD]|uniref:hypothetical protein n=1 Tax=Pseudomonas sp. RIT-PI-AD TaxID=3035294 RepID=UPI0021DA18C7|nr:hypothetical protein [Pseudomonas sp. RIT-PI-AD]
MSACALLPETPLAILPGTTFRDTVRLMQPEWAYRAITAIAGAPAVLTVPGHDLPAEWPVWVRGVQGMAELNAEPGQAPHWARRLDDDNLVINRLSATGKRPSGGELIYQLPVALAGADAAMRIWRGDDLLLELILGQGLAFGAIGSLVRELTPTQTASLTGTGLHYALDVTYADGTVTRYLRGPIA